MLTCITDSVFVYLGRAPCGASTRLKAGGSDSKGLLTLVATSWHLHLGDFISADNIVAESRITVAPSLLGSIRARERSIMSFRTFDKFYH